MTVTSSTPTAMGCGGSPTASRAAGRRSGWSGTAGPTTGCGRRTASTGCGSRCAAPGRSVDRAGALTSTRPRRGRSCCRSSRRSPGRYPALHESAPAASGAPRARASASCAPTSSPAQRGRPLPRPRGQPPRRLERPGRRRPGPAGHLHRRRAVRDRSGNEGTAPAVLPPVPGRSRASRASPCARSPPSRRSSLCAPASASRSSSTRGGALPLARPPRGHRARARRAAGGRARRCLHARRRRLGRLPAAAALRPLQRPRPVPRAGARAGAAARRRPGHQLARRRQGRRRRRRPARHARDRRARDVAARARRRPGLPATFADQTAPLLVFLDRARIRYDLTSDLALDRSRARAPPTARACCWPARCAGSRATLARRLRRYVEDGGQLASFGTDSLRRGVRVGPSRLSRPRSRRRPTRSARASTRSRARARAAGRFVPLTALADDAALGLLTGSDGVVDAFGRLEESQARGRRARGKVVDGARPGRHRRRARRGRGEGRAAARGAAGADRDAAREGRRRPRRAHRLAGARGPGSRGGADHAQHRRRAAPGHAARPLGAAAEDPELRHPQRRGSNSASPVRRQRGPVDRGGVELLDERPAPGSSSGPPYQSSAPWWRASIAPAR